MTTNSPACQAKDVLSFPAMLLLSLTTLLASPWISWPTSPISGASLSMKKASGQKCRSRSREPAPRGKGLAKKTLQTASKACWKKESNLSLPDMKRSNAMRALSLFLMATLCRLKFSKLEKKATSSPIRRHSTALQEDSALIRAPWRLLEERPWLPMPLSPCLRSLCTRLR